MSLTWFRTKWAYKLNFVARSVSPLLYGFSPPPLSPRTSVPFPYFSVHSLRLLSVKLIKGCQWKLRWLLGAGETPRMAPFTLLIPCPHIPRRVRSGERKEKSLTSQSQRPMLGKRLSEWVWTNKKITPTQWAIFITRSLLMAPQQRSKHQVLEDSSIPCNTSAGSQGRLSTGEGRHDTAYLVVSK